MPNWCTNHLVLVGDNKEINQLNDLLTELENKKESFIPNGFGVNWLGCLVNALGGNWEKIRCRGEWYGHHIEDPSESLTNDPNKGELHIWIQYAWCACEEVIKFLEQCYPNMQIYYYAEETGCEVYETNDIEGIYFPERYAMTYYIEGDELEYDTQLFDTLEEALNWVSGIAGVKVEKLEDLETLNAKLEEIDEFNYCNLHEINLVY